MKKIDKKKSFYWIFLAGIAILILAFIYYDSNKEFHEHADFKVFLNGIEINFSKSKYQSDGFKILDEYVHLHDGNGDVIHFHERGISLVHFFNSLEMNVSQNCLTYNSTKYCNNETHQLSFYLNDKQKSDLTNYIAEDLDRILIIYHNLDDDPKSYLGKVTDKACIESALCPERGEPSEGSCVTGSTCAVDLSFLEEE